MRRVRTIGLLSVGVAVVLTASCSGSEDGTAVAPGGDSRQPTSASSSASPSSSQAEGEAAPRVTDPLDTTGLDQDPCTALTAAQVKDFGVSSGEKWQSRKDTVCTYKYGDVDGSQISITPTQSFSNGLSTVYWQKSDMAYFEPTEISGYPGVYAGKYDDRAKGYCNLYVAPNDQRAVWFNMQIEESSRDYPHGCEVGAKVAETMIENLKGGA